MTVRFVLVPHFKIRCEECLYWRPQPERMHGRCIRHAPRDADYQWPETHKAEGCGDFIRNPWEDEELMTELVDEKFAKKNPWFFQIVQCIFTADQRFLHKQSWSWAWHVYTFLLDKRDFGEYYASHNFSIHRMSRVVFPWFKSTQTRRVLKGKESAAADEQRDYASMLVEMIYKGKIHEIFPTLVDEDT